jgi:hypothetical protein
MRDRGGVDITTLLICIVCILAIVFLWQHVHG